MNVPPGWLATIYGAGEAQSRDAQRIAAEHRATLIRTRKHAACRKHRITEREYPAWLKLRRSLGSVEAAAALRRSRRKRRA
jgi:hypothetical protein